MEQNKPSATDIIDRMKTVLGVQMDKELSELLGGSRGFVSVLKNRGTIPYAECITLAIEHNISLDWLILGRGERDIAGAAVVPIQMSHLAELPFFDAASWGSALEGQAWYVPRHWLDMQGLPPSDTIAVRVVGDAMEPALSDGQVVLVNMEQRSVDGVYLVRFGDNVHFRRVQNMTDGSVRLSCDNPAYAAESVPAASRDQLQVIGYCHSIVKAVR
jgi:hypothetical protein